MRHKLTSRALEDLIDLINCHTPDHPIHQSKYYLLKKFTEIITPPEVHYFCEKCQAILPNDNLNEGTRDVIKCTQCYFENIVQYLKDTSCYFLTIPLAIQLKKILESNTGSKLNWESNVNDVRNGTFYKTLKEKNDNKNCKYLTIQWNTDGIQVFNSSKMSVWPIQLMLNELPYREQRENIILVGLWFSPTKPDMNTFLSPFIQELCKLHSEGIDIHLLGHNSPTNFKVYTLISSVDSVARPMIQRIKQFNGKFGCSYCLNEGVIRDVGRGSCRVYLGDVGPKRTLEQHFADCNSIDQLEVDNINGVKGTSVVLLLDTFHIIDSLVPDYMHCVLLGVVKTFVEAWFDSSSFENEWYLGRHVKEFDFRLMNIKPPSEITRTPRSINDRKQYKASEWRTFLLYYSSVCLKGLLHQYYYQHWSLLISAIYGLLKDNCTAEEINNSEDCLKKFVFQIPNLYGENFMKFNVHLLLHLSSHVRRWGSLWAWSAFPYEHYNGVIGNFFRGTQCVPQQILKTYQFKTTMNIMISNMQAAKSNQKSINPRILNLLTRLNGYSHVTNATCLDLQLTTFGIPEVITSLTLTIRQKICIENKTGLQLIENGLIKINTYKRFITNGMLIHTTKYKRLKKRDNSCLYLQNGKFVDITNFLSILVPSNENETILKNILLGNELTPISNNNHHSNIHDTMTKNLATITEESNNIICFYPEEIVSKCVRIWYNNNVYIKPIVNKFERD